MLPQIIHWSHPLGTVQALGQFSFVQVTEYFPLALHTPDMHPAHRLLHTHPPVQAAQQFCADISTGFSLNPAQQGAPGVLFLSGPCPQQRGLFSFASTLAGAAADRSTHRSPTCVSSTLTN